jgi:hypothetical protein
MGACPHYPSRKSFNEPNFGGIVSALTECIYTISGVGTTTFTLDPSGYASNFEGIVQCIEDLNFTLSGIVAGGGGGTASGVAGGSGIYIVQSGEYNVINVNYDDVFYNSVSGHLVGDGTVTVLYSGTTATISGAPSAGGGGGATVVVSGAPGADYNAGALWFDTNEGRLFIYASGNGVASPDWYQTNAEGIAQISEYPPSGTGENAPPRDGSLWFNTLYGALFIYDAVSSGWYETSQTGAAYGAASPAPGQQGDLWYDSDGTRLLIWNGSEWTNELT